MKRKQMGALLVEAGVITPAELEAGLKRQAERDRPAPHGWRDRRLGEILLDLGIIDEDRLAWCLAEMMDLPLLNLNSIFIDPRVLRLLPRARCQELRVLPVSVLDGSLTLAMADPLDVAGFDLVRAVVGMPVRPAVATASSIHKSIQKYYTEDVGLEEIVSRIFPTGELASDDDLGISGEVAGPNMTEEEYLREGDSTPVIRLVNSIIRDAIRMRASDIHIEPTETSSMVRYRIDGLLRNVVSLPLFLHPRNVCRIKILGRMNIAEHRVPQDGSCRVRHKQNEYDLRLSTMPTQFGEKVVIRILSRHEAQIRLEGAGLLPDALAQLRRVLRLPQGMILLTGPTGSGKTTTLYAMLHQLKGESRNIVTLEDPIEYNIPGIMQTQTHLKSGLSFGAGFRALLRQDPDVIMVGEIRDATTADIAFNAAVTGHVVLSTLHTNDTSSAPVRLAELGVSPFLVSTGLKAVVAQRLVRRLCAKCRVPYAPDADTRRLLGLNPNEPIQLYKPGGCSVCNQSGYYGRVGIFEILLPSDKVKDMIFHGESGARIYEQAVREGMRDLMEDAALRVVQGATSLEEVMRMVPLEERRGRCPQCQRGVERYYHTCPFCSFPLWKETCRTCGKELESDWKFCPYCAHGPADTATGAAAPHQDPESAPEPADVRCHCCGMMLRPSWTECPMCLHPVSSQEGGGSPAPAKTAVPSGGRREAEPSPVPPATLPFRPSLLLVTEDPATLIEVRRVAEQAGFCVAQAGSYEEAHRRVASKLPHGVILEGLSPAEDGRLLKKLHSRADGRGVPVAVVVPDSAGEGAVSRIRDFGAAPLFLPLEPRELLAAFSRGEPQAAQRTSA